MTTKLIFFSMLLLMTSCQSQKVNSTDNKTKMEQTKDKNLVYLNEGENVFLKDYQMNVTFKKVTEDSRCPKDANCIWEGVATVEIEMTGTYSRPRTITLNTITDTDKKYTNTGIYAHHRITLVQLLPESKPNNSDNTSYEVGLKIEKIDLKPMAEATTN